MTTFNFRLWMRPFALIGLVLALLTFAGSVSAQDKLVTWLDNPVYGAASGIDATVDLYLPVNAADLLADPAFRRLRVVSLPTVVFVPVLNPQAMSSYVADLTGRGYAVAAIDYRVRTAVTDSLCALSWLHEFAPAFGLDEHRMVAFGYSDGGQIAALMGVMDQTVSTLPDIQAQGCPWPVPESPMIEGVATYDADFATPVVLIDRAHQLATLPPVYTTRDEMIAAFDEFAFIPPDEWAAADLPAPQAVEAELADPLRATFVQASINPDWRLDVAVSLPAFWLDQNAPPHLMMVGEASSRLVHADNALYTELLRDLNVPAQLTEMAGCGHDPCALIGNLEPLYGFLAEVFASS